MYDDLDDDPFLGPEALVSLHFERDEFHLGRGEAIESVEYDPWSRFSHVHDLGTWDEDPLSDFEDEQQLGESRPG